MKTTAIVLASILTVACTSTQKSEPHLSQVNPNIAPSAPVAPSVSAATSSAISELSDLNAEVRRLQGQSDYFDFDKSVIKPEYLAVIQKQADFIKSHPNDVVTVEGNCDERGSEKYNLALGSRRANAVLESLESFGVPAAQIKTVSFGKDKPRLTCHEEKCWKEDRRVDFDHHIG